HGAAIVPGHGPADLVLVGVHADLVAEDRRGVRGHLGGSLPPERLREGARAHRAVCRKSEPVLGLGLQAVQGHQTVALTVAPFVDLSQVLPVAVLPAFDEDLADGEAPVVRGVHEGEGDGGGRHPLHPGSGQGPRQAGLLQLHLYRALAQEVLGLARVRAEPVREAGRYLRHAGAGTVLNLEVLADPLLQGLLAVEPGKGGVGDGLRQALQHSGALSPRLHGILPGRHLRRDWGKGERNRDALGSRQRCLRSVSVIKAVHLPRCAGRTHRQHRLLLVVLRLQDLEVLHQ
ncbi:unnamed protein product, partial [Ixodes pacificus]